MSKKREAFLNKAVEFNSFTKTSIVKNYNISSEEFDYLVASGFLKQLETLICEECLRPWSEAYEECKYCGYEDYYLDTNYYCYS